MDQAGKVDSFEFIWVFDSSMECNGLSFNYLCYFSRLWDHQLAPFSLRARQLYAIVSCISAHCRIGNGTCLGKFLVRALLYCSKWDRIHDVIRDEEGQIKVRNASFYEQHRRQGKGELAIKLRPETKRHLCLWN